MKKHKKLIVILAVVLFIVVALLDLLSFSGVFVTDYSLRVLVEDKLEWQGRSYSVRHMGSIPFKTDRVVAKSENGWLAHGLKGDPDRNFLYQSPSLTEHRLYIADDYEIPKSGKITAINFDYKRKVYKSGNIFRKVRKIIDESETSFVYESPELFTPSENEDFTRIIVAYENCPCVTVKKGFIGKLEGEWVYVRSTEMIEDVNPEYSAAFKYKLDCYLIPSKYHSFLEMHF